MTTTKLKKEQLSTEVLTLDNVKTINNQSIVGTGNIDVGGSGSKAYLSLNKVKDYLYQTTYADLDYTFAKEYFRTRKPVVNLGACSTVRNGNFVGRNYDWNYTDSVSFVINTPRANNHYASVSIASSIPGLTEKYMSSDSYDEEKFQIMPFFALDGINEYGLTASNLVVPMQYGTTTGTTPQEEQKEEICNLMLVRYVLDHFKTVAEAVLYLKKYVSVYTLESLKEMNYELHFMISDETETRVIEFINNTIVDIPVSSIPYLTNFFIYGATPSAIQIGDDVPIGGVYTPATVSQGYKPSDLGITSLGSGLERYNFIVKNYDMAYTKDGMQKLMFNTNQSTASLRYTRSYLAGTDPQWNTEFVGEWLWEDEGGRHHVNLTTDNPAEDFTIVKNHVRPFYEADVRDGKTWQTEHSSVYDLKNRKLYLIVQEDGEELEFGLSYYTRQELANNLVWEKGAGVDSVQTIQSEVNKNNAAGNSSVSEGAATDAHSFASHAEGYMTSTGVSADYSHAEGYKTSTQGVASHAEGDSTVTNNPAEHAEGRYNQSNIGGTDATNTLSSIGIGNASGSIPGGERKNAFEVMQNGDAYMIGIGNYDGKNYSTATTIQDVIDNKQNKHYSYSLDLSQETETYTLTPETFTTCSIINLGTYGCHIIVSQPKASVFFTTGNTLPSTLDIGFPSSFGGLDLYLNNVKVNNITFETNTTYYITTEIRVDASGDNIAVAFVCDGKGN